MEARLLSGGSPQYEPAGHLLSAGDAPSFLNLYTAAPNFFWMASRLPAEPSTRPSSIAIRNVGPASHTSGSPPMTR